MFSKLALAIMNPFLPWTHCPQGKGALKLTTVINILVFTWPDWKLWRCAWHLIWGSRVSSPPFLLPMLTMLFGSFFILSHHRSLPKLESAPDRLTATVKETGFFFFFFFPADSDWKDKLERQSSQMARSCLRPGVGKWGPIHLESL